MAKFKYTATDPQGAKTSGSISAATIARARQALAERELQVIDIGAKKGVLQFEITKKGVPRQEIMHLSRQLAAFIRSGVPILDAIQVIADETGNTSLRGILTDISDALRGGEPLSAAIAAHGHVFPRFYVDMIRAAELTGRLDVVLDQLSLYIERDLEARQKIRSAMAYPLIIVVLSVVVIVILAAFVLPRFKQFFESLHARLPLPTRMLLAMSSFVENWWWAIIGVVLVAGLALYGFLKTEAGRKIRDRIFLGLPVVGDVVLFSIVERFCRILGALVQAGVPLPDAMEVVSEGTNNRIFESGLTTVREAMLEGEGIAKPIARTDLFPSAVVQMMRVGEETGTLDQQLELSASFYERELSYKIKRLTTYFEPAVILAVGLIVGFVAVAVVSAMYGIFRQVGTI
jgi:type IV pilus assembly protein PilC